MATFLRNDPLAPASGDMTSTRARNLALLTFLLAIVVGCGTDPAEDRPEGPDGYGDDLGTAEEKGESADRVIQCGGSACEPALCGYDCTSAGRLCPAMCAATDRRGEAFVEFTSTGDHAADRDSRDLPYMPVLRLTNALFYGCELWDFTSTNKQGLEIGYGEIYLGAFVVGDPRDIGYELEVYAQPFTGPGTYKASGFLSRSSAARDARDYYYTEDGCSVTVEVAGDGISGRYRCDKVPHRTETSRSIALSGTFGCGANALDTNIIAMPPR